MSNASLADLEEIEDVPPSAKLVALVLLEADDYLLRRQIENRTHLHEQVVHKALRRLEERDVLSKVSHPTDGRMYIYSVREDPGGRS